MFRSMFEICFDLAYLEDGSRIELNVGYEFSTHVAMNEAIAIFMICA